MYTQYFFLSGKLLATAPRKPEIHHEDVNPPSSLIYFCKCCGAIYATMPVIRDGTDQVSEWQSHRGICRGCRVRFPSSYEAPGSIWRSWHSDFLDALPVPVLQYEFDRHFDNLENLK